MKLQTILLISANPKDTHHLQLDKEFREIAEGLKRAQKREHFKLEQHVAVRPRDIYRILIELEPQIVHFSGHGLGKQGLIFEDECGNAKPVEGSALARLFKLFSDKVICVVLNGCYSEIQAKEIVQYVPYVIGMDQAIGDNAAVAFSVGFYDALCAGRNIEFAYRLGCASIHLEGINEYLKPKLLMRSSNTEDQDCPTFSFSSISPPLCKDEATKIFISYSHKDEKLKDDLCDHLASLVRQGKIKTWHDRAIEAGAEWDEKIKEQLQSAAIILLLITPQFIASEYCFDVEMRYAMERHAAKTARVIPIIMRPCDWQNTAFSKLKALPKDAKPVTVWSDKDEALLNVVKGINNVVDSLRESSINRRDAN